MVQFKGPRLGRKKAADPQDQAYLAKDRPDLALIADPRETGKVHEAGSPANLRRAGFEGLTGKAAILGVPEWAADLPQLSRTHKRSPLFPLDQDGESSCVGNGHVELVLAGPVMQEKFITALRAKWGIAPASGVLTKEFAEQVALEWYRRAQDLDEWPGNNYDGTSVRAGCKVGQQLGLWTEYNWLTSVAETARYMILHNPVVIGIDMFEGDMNPRKFTKQHSATAILEASGAWVGGHCMLADYVNIKREVFGGPQTWGGDPYARWEMGFEDFDYRIRQGADIVAISEVRITA